MSAGTDYLAKPILDWLRERADGSLAGRKYREAADEIERLRGVLAKAQNDLEDERRQRHFTAGETEKVIRALHAAAVQPAVALTPYTVTVEPVIVSDAPDAQVVKLNVGVQHFRVGPDYWETRDEAYFFRWMLRQALSKTGATEQSATDPTSEILSTTAKGG